MREQERGNPPGSVIDGGGARHGAKVLRGELPGVRQHAQGLQAAAQVGEEDDGEPGGPEEEEADLQGQGVTDESQGQTAVTDRTDVGADVTAGEQTDDSPAPSSQPR